MKNFYYFLNFFLSMNCYVGKFSSNDLKSLLVSLVLVSTFPVTRVAVSLKNSLFTLILRFMVVSNGI